MATTYKKNAQNVYKVPLYARFWAWWGLVLGLAVLFFGLGRFVRFEIVQIGQFALWSLVAILTIWRAYSIAKQWIKAETFGKFITNVRQKRQSLGAYLRQCPSIGFKIPLYLCSSCGGMR